MAKAKDRFPLWLHPCGLWCKKIKGRHCYFGSDKDAALKWYVAEREDLEAGRKPRRADDTLTVADLVDAFLNERRRVGRLRELTCERGPCTTRVGRWWRSSGPGTAADLRPEDFADLRAERRLQAGGPGTSSPRSALVARDVSDGSQNQGTRSSRRPPRTATSSSWHQTYGVVARPGSTPGPSGHSQAMERPKSFNPNVNTDPVREARRDAFFYPGQVPHPVCKLMRTWRPVRPAGRRPPRGRRRAARDDKFHERPLSHGQPVEQRQRRLGPVGHVGSGRRTGFREHGERFVEVRAYDFLLPSAGIAR